MGLFDLLKEETKVEEPQKEEIKEAEVVENEAAVNEPKKEVKKKTKKNSKPETKNERVKKEPETKSLEEQIATVPDNLKTKIDVIYQHLMTIPGMGEKMRNPNKTITDMFKYIENQARKQAVKGCAMVEDQVVFGWAVHYYDEENVE
jgi:hypothetical protein